MANSRMGGVIIFGVADADRQVVGLKDPSASIDLALRAARMVKPPISLVGAEPRVQSVDGYTLVVAEIPPNDGTLYQSSGVFWLRRGSHTVPMSSDEIRQHLHATGALQWETALCPNATLDDFDDERIAHYLAFRAERSRQNLRYTSREQLLVGLGCAARDPQVDQVRPTNVGILMFGRDPHWWIPQAEIVVMHYADDIGAKKIANRQIITGTGLVKYFSVH